MKMQECEAVEEIAAREQAPDMEEAPISPLADCKGHRSTLLFGEGVMLGRKVVVYQLDLANEATGAKYAVRPLLETT